MPPEDYTTITIDDEHSSSVKTETATQHRD